MSTDSQKPFLVGEDTKIKMSLKTLLLILGGLAVAVTSWVIIKLEVGSHTAQLQSISVTVGDDHDQLKIQGAILQQQQSMLERIDRKLDRLNNPRGGSILGSSP